MNYLRQRKKILSWVAISAVVIFSILWIARDESEHCQIYLPSYEKKSLDFIFEEIQTTGDFLEKERDKPVLSQIDYDELFSQTGLGKEAVDYIIGQGGDYKQKIKDFQTIFFDGYPYECAKISMFTSNERIRDADGKKLKGYELADLRAGDVLVSFSTHTAGYRHGHCAIVVENPKDGKEAKTLEAVYWGKSSEYKTTGKWRYCPTFIHLRLSEEAASAKGYTQDETGMLLAEIAKEKCVGVEYNLMPELFNIKSGELNKTHCAHLIWYIYSELGYDVDSDGGLVVTPYDIATSKLFDIIQIYGIDAEELTSGN